MPRLLLIANGSGRDYGTEKDMIEQYEVLKQRFADLNVPEKLGQANRWLKVCSKEKLYIGKTLHRN